MAKFWLLETKNASNGMYYPVRDKNGKAKQSNSIIVARKMLLKAMTEAPYYCEVGAIHTSRDGKAITFGVIKIKFGESGRIWTWHQYGTTGTRIHQLYKDGTLGKKLE